MNKGGMADEDALHAFPSPGVLTFWLSEHVGSRGACGVDWPPLFAARLTPLDTGIGTSAAAAAPLAEHE